jgi:hypothetical protein
MDLVMKYALVEGHKREAEPRFTGECKDCGSRMIAKCGERRIWHWAHRGKQHCDHWWEPETEWHRAWKNKFPAEWQEISHRADDGERHIADVKTAQSLVIEFQHSYLNPDERRSREAFYKPMFWVVNGLRRKRDKQSFYETLRVAPRVNIELLTFRVLPNECTILREWIDSRVPVFFDFRPTQEDIAWFRVSVLWRLDPSSVDNVALLSPVPAEKFIEGLNKGEPVTGFRNKIIERKVQRIPVWGLRPVRKPWISRARSFRRF